MTTNPNCCGGVCTCDTGEVRVLPIGSDPNHGILTLCRDCYMHEMNYRRERNKKLGKDFQYKLPSWESLEVYK